MNLRPTFAARQGARPPRFRASAARWDAAAPAHGPAAPPYALAPQAGLGHHPLADDALSAALRQQATEIDAAFSAIAPALRELVPGQFAPEFPARAAAFLRERLGIEVAPHRLQAAWTRPLDIHALYADCLTETFRRLVAGSHRETLAACDEGESVETLIRRWGFHAVDITPCADGRLAGVIDYILRIPRAVVAYRQSYAGAMFEVAEAMANWERTELSRFSAAVPNAALEPTRYLKVGVYPFSSVDPDHGGCAAHGSDTDRAARAVLERLVAFAEALQATHRAQAAILLIGVDTDTDAIRVHVPDRDGKPHVGRWLSSAALYDATLGMPREDGKAFVRREVTALAGVDMHDTESEGMRWFCSYLLKNNFGQVESVRAHEGGRYAEAGHTEKLIVVGDPVDDVQLRNLAFEAQMRTVEEGAVDLDIGVRVLAQHHTPANLPVTVLVNATYDERIPVAEAAAVARATRLARAVAARYPDLSTTGILQVRAIVRGLGGTPRRVELSPEQEFAA